MWKCSYFKPPIKWLIMMYILIFYVAVIQCLVTFHKHARKNNSVIKRMKILLIKMVSRYSVNISLFSSPAKRSVYSIIRDVGQTENERHFVRVLGDTDTHTYR